MNKTQWKNAIKQLFIAKHATDAQLQRLDTLLENHWHTATRYSEYLMGRLVGIVGGILSPKYLANTPANMLINDFTPILGSYAAPIIQGAIGGLGYFCWFRIVGRLTHNCFTNFGLGVEVMPIEQFQQKLPNNSHPNQAEINEVLNLLEQANANLSKDYSAGYRMTILRAFAHSVMISTNMSINLLDLLGISVASNIAAFFKPEAGINRFFKAVIENPYVNSLARTVLLEKAIPDNKIKLQGLRL